MAKVHFANKLREMANNQGLVDISQEDQALTREHSRDLQRQLDIGTLGRIQNCSNNKGAPNGATNMTEEKTPDGKKKPMNIDMGETTNNGIDAEQLAAILQSMQKQTAPQPPAGIGDGRFTKEDLLDALRLSRGQETKGGGGWMDVAKYAVLAAGGAAGAYFLGGAINRPAPVAAPVKVETEPARVLVDIVAADDPSVVGHTHKSEEK